MKGLKGSIRYKKTVAKRVDPNKKSPRVKTSRLEQRAKNVGR